MPHSWGTPPRPPAFSGFDDKLHSGLGANTRQTVRIKGWFMLIGQVTWKTKQRQVPMPPALETPKTLVYCVRKELARRWHSPAKEEVKGKRRPAVTEWQQAWAGAKDTARAQRESNYLVASGCHEGICQAERAADCELPRPWAPPPHTRAAAWPGTLQALPLLALQMGSCPCTCRCMRLW